MNRDTHELRLEHWPRLSTFPTTAAVVAAAIALDFLTFVAWFTITLTLLHKAQDAASVVAAAQSASEILPDGWLLFLAGLHGIATTHFGVKRKTDFRNAPKNGDTPAVSP